MKYLQNAYALPCFILIILFSLSCTKDCDDDDLVPIIPSNLDIDQTLSIDTIWHLDFDKNITKLKLFDEYLIVINHMPNDIRSYNFYSTVSGKLVNTFVENNFRILEEYIFDDVFIAHAWDEKGRYVIFTYDINSQMINMSDTLKTATRYLTSNYFIEKNDSFLLKIDYNLSILDTIYQFDKNFNGYDMKMEKITLSGHNQREYLVVAYIPNKEKRLHFLLIDLKTNIVEDELIFSSGHFIYKFEISDEILNIACINFKFSYDLQLKNYFIISNTFSSNNTNIFSISKRTNERAKVFYNNDNSIYSTDLISGNLSWSWENEKSDYIYPIDILNINGELIPYMSFTQGTDFGLMDPYSGLVKTFSSPRLERNKLYFEYKNARVYNKSELIYAHQFGATKIKFVKN